MVVLLCAHLISYGYGVGTAMKVDVAKPSSMAVAGYMAFNFFSSVFIIGVCTVDHLFY